MPRIKNPITIVGTTGAAAPVLQELTVTASGVHTPPTGVDGFSKVTASFDESTELTRLRKLIDGTLTALVVPSNMTKVKEYLCYKSSSNSTLTSVDLGNVSTIEQRAFYYNTAIVFVLQTEDGVSYFPRNVKTFGSYCLYYAGNGKRNTNIFVLHPNGTASVADYAWYYGNCAKVKGTYSQIGSYAFASANVNEVDIVCTGALGSYAFQGNPITSLTVQAAGISDYALNITSNVLSAISLKVTGAINSYGVADAQYVESFTLDPTSVISSLGTCAFRGLGARRNGTTNFVLDFTNSAFTSVNTQAFYPNSTSYPTKGLHIKLPATVTTIGDGAFGYLKNSIIEFATTKPPTVSYSSAFANMSGTYLVCPHNAVGAYRTNTNMTAVASMIRGKITGVSALPELNSEGYELTWYHDVACTNAVQSGDTIDSSATYYCTASANKVAYPISFTGVGCTVAPTAGGVIYASGDMVRTGTVLTINITPDAATPTPYILTLNGNDISAGDTYTVAEAVNITALYWDGENVPVNPTFGDNSWSMIKLAADNGLTSLWSVGATKVDGNGVTWMLVDLTPNRYAKVGGGYTQLAVMRVPLYDDNTTWRTSTNSENYSQSLLNTKLSAGGAYFLLEEESLRNLVNDNKITVKASQASSSTTVDCTVGFFAPAYTELGFTGTYGNATNAETVCNGITKGAFEYFASNQNALRVKSKSGGSATTWWTRSRSTGNYAVFVNGDGSINNSNAGNSRGACACFAF